MIDKLINLLNKIKFFPDNDKLKHDYLGSYIAFIVFIIIKLLSLFIRIPQFIDIFIVLIPLIISIMKEFNDNKIIKNKKKGSVEILDVLFSIRISIILLIVITLS